MALFGSTNGGGKSPPASRDRVILLEENRSQSKWKNYRPEWLERIKATTTK
jgi:hypothetical protein